MRARRAVAAIVVAVVAAGAWPSGSSAAEPPVWLQEIARRNNDGTGALVRGADAVVLYDHVNVSVSKDGRLVTRRSYAARVLRPNGGRAAAVRELYQTDNGRVRSMRAWIFPRGGTMLELGTSDVVDRALVNNDIYNEVRVRTLTAPTVAPGDLFGAETETVERTPFGQIEWSLQDKWPVRHVRRTLTLPRGWSARAVTFNRAPIEPARVGLSYVWELRDLAPPGDEPGSPPPSATAPRVAVTFRGAGAATPGFEDWMSVSRWLAKLAGSQDVASPAIAAKVRELTAGAASDLEKARAVGLYVQQVQYISIQTGLGRGGGYKPRSAADVFDRNYGDCKDKANLMRAMLASLGIRAYLVATYTGDADYVRDAWPSPQQFNHAIVAMGIDGASNLPAALNHVSPGGLLFFDPTDPYTPLGEIPTGQQGSLALIVSPDGGPLVRMPIAPPESNATVRYADAKLSATGAIAATIRHTTTGSAASDQRAAFQSLTREEYMRLLGAAMHRQAPPATLSLGEVSDDRAQNRFQQTIVLQADHYAQRLADGLMLIRPPAPLRRPLPAVRAATRRSPMVVDAREEHDELHLALPAGMVVDEMPAPVALHTPFGVASVRWRLEGNIAVRETSLRIPRATLPAQDAGALVAFLDAFREAEQLPLVVK